MCKSCVGYDANALYLNCLSLELPVSYFVRWLPVDRENSTSFKRDKSERYTIAYDWLDWIAYRDSLFISHKLNSGSEKSVGPYFVDGFDESNNTCYEFYGCYFHACPKENCNIYKIKKDRNRYVRTMQREAFINKMGYKVISMWECKFKELIKSNSKLRNFLQQKDLKFSRTHSHREVKQSDILEGVVNDTFFGMVEVDIHVPPHLRSYFEEMSPLFVTSKIPFQNIGEHMQKYARDQNLEENDKTLLVSGMKARKILLASPLLKWYLDHGLSVTRVHQAVEFGRGRCFKSFTERVTEARRMGDIDPDAHIKADVMKLIGNGGYGSLLMQKEKHTSCKYVHGVHKAKLQVNKAQFVSLTELPSDNYEIISSKRRTNLNLPTQVGFFVLQYAKLRMLEFYHNFLDVFADRRDFECLQMDTDSLYLAISENDLSEIIRPEKKDDYNHMLRGYSNQSDVISDASNHFFPRTCCEEHAKRDKRTPGLFKLESQGVKMISLNSKTYVLQTDERDPEKVKLSSKGLNKSSINQAVKTYERVLNAKESQCAVNTGFRPRDNTVYSYQQVRWGMSYFYCKRVVQSDGVSTKPLDLELVPAKLTDIS